MKLKLVKLEPKYRRQLTEMMEEWYATGEKIIPWAIRRLDYRNFDHYLANLQVQDTSEGLVPDSTYFCLDQERDIFVGAVNIRHYLNEARCWMAVTSVTAFGPRSAARGLRRP